MALSLVFVVCLVTTAAAQTTEIIGGCGDTSHNGPSGVISSPNYPGNYDSNLNCDYYIYASTGSSISLIFKSFNTEEGLDLATISCPTNSNFRQQEYSGHSLPDPVSITGCSQGKVNFRTDNSTVYSGFSLEYFVSVQGCGNTMYSNSNGQVTSPNWPDYYPNNQDCYNIIWAPQRSTFHLYFEQFYLQTCCVCDFMELRCLDNSENIAYTYCGTRNGLNLYFYQCSQVLLYFHSDSYNFYQGFLIQYNVYPDAIDMSSEMTTMGAISGPGLTTPQPDGVTTDAYVPPEPCTRSTAVYVNFEPEVDTHGVQISSRIIRRGSPKCIVVCQKQCSASIAKCTDRPCRNNGTCVDISTGYRCECPLGFTGTNCEQELDCDGVTCVQGLASYGG